MDKKAVIGGALRTLLSGASSLRLLDWCSKAHGRELSWSVRYEDGKPKWFLRMYEADTEKLFTGDTLEQVVYQAMAAIGFK